MAQYHICQPVMVLCAAGQHNRLLCLMCTSIATPCAGCQPAMVPLHMCQASLTVVCKSGTHKWAQCGICQPVANRCPACPLVPVMATCRPVYVIHRRVFPSSLLQGVANVVEAARGGSATHWAVVIGAIQDPGALRFELRKDSGLNSATINHAWVPDKKGDFDLLPKDLGGYTWMGNEQITSIVQSIITQRPVYKRRTSDCQNFAVDLLVRIVERPSPELCYQSDKRTVQRWEEEMGQIRRVYGWGGDV